MPLFTSHLELIDSRNEPFNKFDWMVIGTIYENDQDDCGTDITEGFDSAQIAANFIVNSLAT